MLLMLMQKMPFKGFYCVHDKPVMSTWLISLALQVAFNEHEMAN